MKRIGTIYRFLLSAAVLMTFYLNLPQIVSAQTAAYNRDAMMQALATRQYYDLYGIRFDLDKATIQREADALLDDIATALRNFPDWRMRIIGHTDVSGIPANNDKLSLDRANAIKLALVNRGIDAARLETAGMGQIEPVASNDTNEGRALNRRVELVRLGAIETEALRLLKAMSDYLASQKFISFNYDANYEVVTKDSQKLLLASSGAIVLNRPDKVRVTRTGGFANLEMLFDGQTLTLLGKNANVYAQAVIPGTIDNLVDELRDRLGRPIPGADLLLSNVLYELTSDVIEGKDLGSGVIGSAECDHLAFRTQGRRLADLDRAGRAPLSLPLYRHLQKCEPGAAIQHSNLGLEKRHPGCRDQFWVRKYDERQKGRHE